MSKPRKSFWICGFHEKTLNGDRREPSFINVQELDYSEDIDEIYQGWLHRCHVSEGKVTVKDLISDSKTSFTFPKENLKAKDVASGWDKIYVIASDGSCWYAKLNQSTCANARILEEIPLPVNSLAKCVDVGDAKTVLLLQDGCVYEVIHKDDIPSLVPIETSEPVQSIACGKEHVVLLTNGGTVLSYGTGSRGQLGHGNLEALSEPTVLEALDGISIKCVSSGGWHSAALNTDGDAYVWGWNESCQLGFPNKTCEGIDKEEAITMQALPKLLDFSDNVVDIKCGSRHTVALANDQLWCWGWNGQGQLGTSSEEFFQKPKVMSLPNSIKFPFEIQCKHWTTIFTLKS